MTRRERERNRRKRQIKERVSNILSSLLLLFIIFGSWAIVSYIEHNYTRETTVIGVTDNNTIIVKDTVGHTWSFVANDDELVKGTKVKVKINDNCTFSIYDDEIWDYKIIK